MLNILGQPLSKKLSFDLKKNSILKNKFKIEKLFLRSRLRRSQSFVGSRYDQPLQPTETNKTRAQNRKTKSIFDGGPRKVGSRYLFKTLCHSLGLVQVSQVK